MSAASPLRTQHILLPSRRGQQRIAPQVGVIVEVFITQRQRVCDLFGLNAAMKTCRI
jgi:hypothetical protein